MSIRLSIGIIVLLGTATAGAQTTEDLKRMDLEELLNINVTTVVPGSGPAVTYRFATAQAPTRSSSPGVTP